MKKLFITVDEKGNLIPTSGTYSIGRIPSKGAPITVVFSTTYSGGGADDTGVFIKGDTIYIYPTDYIGTSTIEQGAKVVVLPAKVGLGMLIDKKRQYIESKIKDVKF
jgi:hypothetical protein